jgi:hypothetical protein
MMICGPPPPLPGHVTPFYRRACPTPAPLVTYHHPAAVAPLRAAARSLHPAPRVWRVRRFWSY